MSANSKIEWTDHTFNIAWGCTKISPGCKNCYAETGSKRYGFDVWGPKATRRTFGEKYWSEPLKWNRAAEKSGKRARVFCSSMCDIAEDHPVITEECKKLWPLIKSTPWLDWQLLTKRPERYAEILPDDWGDGYPNVWLGTSVESQKYADERIPHLLGTPAAIRFLSCEPLLDAVNISLHCPKCGYTKIDNAIHGDHYLCKGGAIPEIHWTIVGGESGPNARPCDIHWIRDIVVQCKAAGVPVFVKQLGSHPYSPRLAGKIPLRDRKGGDISEWPEDMRVRELPTTTRERK